MYIFTCLTGKKIPESMPQIVPIIVGENIDLSIFEHSFSTKIATIESPIKRR